MNEFQIQLTETRASTLLNNAGLLLKELFRRDSKNYDILAYEIMREFKAGGSPQVTHMDFDRVSFDTNSGQGKFRVVLDINFTFGCEDVKTEKEGQTSEWTFAFNPNAATLTFHSSPFAEIRSTADEF